MHSVEYEDSFVKIAGLIGGEEYTKVARALLNAEDTTDEEIAGATGLRINIIRKVLYDMFGKALITGIRVKDEKKGCLYIDGVQNRIRLTILLTIRRKRSSIDYKRDWNMKNHLNFITVATETVLVSNLTMR